MRISLLIKTLQPNQSNPNTKKMVFQEKLLEKRPVSFSNWLVGQRSDRPVLTNENNILFEIYPLYCPCFQKFVIALRGKIQWWKKDHYPFFFSQVVVWDIDRVVSTTCCLLLTGWFRVSKIQLALRAKGSEQNNWIINNLEHCHGFNTNTCEKLGPR